MALGGVGLNLLYGHGKFSAEDVTQTLYCLWGYALGLVPAVFILLLATGFYARKAYLVPTLSSLFAVLLNAALNLCMVTLLHWGTVSVAIATSLAAWVNCSILGWSLRREIPSLFTPAFWSYCGKLTTCASIAVLCTYGVGLGFGQWPRSFLAQGIQFSAATTLYLASFFALAYLLRVKELFALFRSSSSE